MKIKCVGCNESEFEFDTEEILEKEIKLVFTCPACGAVTTIVPDRYAQSIKVNTAI